MIRQLQGEWLGKCRVLQKNLGSHSRYSNFYSVYEDTAVCNPTTELHSGELTEKVFRAAAAGFELPERTINACSPSLACSEENCARFFTSIVSAT